jgi:hypothetical protein
MILFVPGCRLPAVTGCYMGARETLNKYRGKGCAHAPVSH